MAKELRPQFTFGEILGAVIRYERRMTGLTQHQVASRTGMLESTLSRIEAGKIHMSIARLRSIAREIGIEAHKLLARAEKLCDKISEVSPGSHVHEERNERGWFPGAPTARSLVLELLVKSRTPKR